MTELTQNEMMQVDGGVFPIAYAALFVASVALGYNIGNNIWPE